MGSLPKPMKIYIASIPFDAGSGIKSRPAFVVVPGSVTTGVLKITSQYRNKPQSIRKLYFPIKQWKKAGLTKPSYVDIHMIYQIPTSTIVSRQPIGKLTDEDALNLVDMVRKWENDKQ